jgi:hypothetical protein
MQPTKSVLSFIPVCVNTVVAVGGRCNARDDLVTALVIRINCTIVFDYSHILR